MSGRHAIQYLSQPADLGRIRFVDGIAAVEVAWPLIRHIRFKNDVRECSPRLERVLSSIRANGFVPVDPIVAMIGQKGKWIVVDGGHRLTAARMVAEEWLTNLFEQKVRSLYFLLYTTPRSWRKVRDLAPADLPEAAPVMVEDHPSSAATGPADRRGQPT